jgi:hypothetical protein
MGLYTETLELADLVGRHVLGVQMTPGKDDVRFITTTGNLDYVCYGDCCSESWVNHVNDIDKLIDATVTQVEEVDFYGMLGAEPEPTRQDSDDVLFHRIHTNKGTCLIEFRNSSNGYYGGSFERNDDHEPEGLVDSTEDF